MQKLVLGILLFEVMVPTLSRLILRYNISIHTPEYECDALAQTFGLEKL